MRSQAPNSYTVIDKKMELLFVLDLDVLGILV